MIQKNHYVINFMINKVHFQKDKLDLVMDKKAILLQEDRKHQLQIHIILKQK